MIKPIVYHNIEEKEALERKLMATIPSNKRASASKALMNLFSRQDQNPATSKGKSKTKAK